MSESCCVLDAGKIDLTKKRGREKRNATCMSTIQE